MKVAFFAQYVSVKFISKIWDDTLDQFTNYAAAKEGRFATRQNALREADAHIRRVSTEQRDREERPLCTLGNHGQNNAPSARTDFWKGNSAVFLI